MQIIGADADFAKVYGIQMQEGVFLKYNTSTNSQNNIVLNEAAVKALGWTSAVGKTIKLGAANSPPQTNHIRLPIRFTRLKIPIFQNNSPTATLNNVLLRYL